MRSAQRGVVRTEALCAPGRCAHRGAVRIGSGVVAAARLVWYHTIPYHRMRIVPDRCLLGTKNNHRADVPFVSTMASPNTPKHMNTMSSLSLFTTIVETILPGQENSKNWNKLGQALGSYRAMIFLGTVKAPASMPTLHAILTTPPSTDVISALIQNKVEATSSTEEGKMLESLLLAGSFQDFFPTPQRAVATLLTTVTSLVKDSHSHQEVGENLIASFLLTAVLLSSSGENHYKDLWEALGMDGDFVDKITVKKQVLRMLFGHNSPTVALVDLFEQEFAFKNSCSRGKCKPPSSVRTMASEMFRARSIPLPEPTDLGQLLRHRGLLATLEETSCNENEPDNGWQYLIRLLKDSSIVNQIKLVSDIKREHPDRFEQVCSAMDLEPNMVQDFAKASRLSSEVLSDDSVDKGTPCDSISNIFTVQGMLNNPLLRAILGEEITRESVAERDDNIAKEILRCLENTTAKSVDLLTVSEKIAAGLSPPDAVLASYLGSGAFGAVYKAYDSSNNQFQYVVKAQQEQLTKFWCEIVRHVVLASRLDREYAIQFLGWDFYKQAELQDALPSVPDNAVIRFYFELGVETLEDYRTRELVPLVKAKKHFHRLISAVLQIMERLSACIAHFHGKQVIHRDLKPENIVFAEGKWKISDPGSAKDLDPMQGGATLDRGTRYYVPDDRHCGTFTDVFSLGAIAFELLTGKLNRKPTYTPTLFEGKPIFNHTKVGGALQGLIAKATSIKHENRPHAAEFLSEVQQIMTTMGLQPQHKNNMD